ncbi:conserved hypothetical protein [Planktothrix serta PCC 8927]|uniref:DUF2839 domain-containing protein n=1 Tax=Planktothrix serta PCC 8927 TaxID=671068 RepID=A0A7Z9C041_9CYAN|nr:DUF2839 domain-containing protein [Planktothrix serta]VXD24609.1 conserved hypothetical protein [Planktothrix serta PCC 8927]
MGEAKRRKQNLKEQYGQEEKIVSWLPITKNQSQQFIEITSKASWLGIGLLVAVWVTIRFIGPGLGWWQID